MRWDDGSKGAMHALVSSCPSGSGRARGDETNDIDTLAVLRSQLGRPLNQKMCLVVDPKHNPWDIPRKLCWQTGLDRVVLVYNPRGKLLKSVQKGGSICICYLNGIKSPPICVADSFFLLLCARVQVCCGEAEQSRAACRRVLVPGAGGWPWRRRWPWRWSSPRTPV
jgi:hypothetical protein